MKPRVKICGLTTPEDVAAAVEAGADALGFNFYAPSPRSVTKSRALELLARLPPMVEPIALFVNESWDAISEFLAEMPSIRTVQVHGDTLVPCPRRYPFRWIPAFPIRGHEDLERVRTFVARCRIEGNPPAAVLVDAHVPGSYGGTGQTPPWERLVDFDAGVPLILAGGLKPENVAEAVRLVRPYAVDVASGVESSPGRKDPAKMQAFVKAAARWPDPS